MSRCVESNRAKGKFCSVCKNAGKDEKLYTSHFPKSSNGPDGVVVCPTILSNECSYCHKLGHFKQQCPVLEAKKNGTYIPKEKENIKIENKPIIKFEPENNKNLKKLNINSIFQSIKIEKKTESFLNNNNEYIPSPEFIKYLSKYEIGHDWRDDEYWDAMELI